MMPEGLCLSLTAVETLLTFCPPAPPDLKASNSRSSSFISTSAGFSITGKTSTKAKEV